MRAIKTSLAFVALLCAGPDAVPAETADFVVIVHPETPVDSISRAELSAIFLKKQNRWADGTHVEPLDLSATTTTRKAFSEEVHGLSADALQAYWQRQIFSGRENPPRVKSIDDAIDFVRSTRGSIAYLPPGDLSAGLKVLTVTETQ